MAELWGHRVGRVPPSTVGAGSSEFPTQPDQLSKKCRRLLAAACSRGRAERKGGDVHFDSLVLWGLLSRDGEPTEKGREWNGRKSSETEES